MTVVAAALHAHRCGRDGYSGASRTFLFSPTAQEFFDAKNFIKVPP